MLAMLKPAARDLAARALYAARITRPARTARERLTIVTFHRVLPAPQRETYPLPEIAVTPDELGFCLDFFARHFHCGPLCEMAELHLRGERASRPLLAITFDDGQRDNFEHARPELEQRGLRASFFVPVEAVESGMVLWHDRLAYAAAAWLRRAPVEAAAALGARGADDTDAVLQRVLAQAKALPAERRLAWVDELEQRCGGQAVPAWDGMMSWEQIRVLADAGHEIGSHSMTHPILPLCNDAQLAQEVGGSRAALAERLRRDPQTFCYPNGDCDSRTVDAVDRAGYRFAVTTRWGTNPRSAPVLELRRCDIDVQRVRSPTGALAPAQLAWRLSGLYPGLQ